MWETVHGEPIEAYLREKDPERARLGGNIIVNVAIVAHLTRSAAEALMLGLPVNWS